MDTLNETLKVNVKPPPKEEDDDSLCSDDEVLDLREQVLTHGRIKKWRRNQPKYEMWIAAWDEQLWTMWCMMRNFRDDGCFQILDKVEDYSDWCKLVWDNTKY